MKPFSVAGAVAVFLILVLEFLNSRANRPFVASASVDELRISGKFSLTTRQPQLFTTDPKFVAFSVAVDGESSASGFLVPPTTQVKANVPCRGGNNFLSIKLSGKLLTLDAPGSCPQEVNIFVMYQ